MRLLLYILFLALISIPNILGQNLVNIENVDAPQFVLDETEYTVSSKITLDEQVDKIILYLHTDMNTSLKKVEFNSPKLNKQLRFSRVEGESPLSKIYKIESNEIDLENNIIGRLLATLTTQNAEKASLFMTEVNPEFSPIDWQEKLAEINIYEESKIAGECLELNQSSELTVDVNLNEIENRDLVIEFWANINSDSTKFLSIAEENGDEITSLTKGIFGYLTVPSLLDAEYFKENYIDEKSWNYFLIRLNMLDGKIKIYVNEDIYFISPNYQLENQNKIGIMFSNLGKEGSVKLDRIKIWSFGNNEEIALTHKNYNNYQADSSKVIFVNNFDSKKISEQLKIEGNFSLEESTAPIFSRAPVLKAAVFNQNFHLNWELSELADVQSIEVEKSYNGSEFSVIHQIQVTDKSKTQYSFGDFDISDHQIIYYRVKQINKDGSELYSSAVKVGRGKQIHFKVNQNYPNPFNPITTVAVDVKRSAEFIVRVYDIVGNVIEKLHEGVLSKGTHRFDFNGKDLPSGLYFFEVKSEDDLEVMKMILAK